MPAGERRTAASCKGCSLCPCFRQERLVGLCQLPLGTPSQTGIILHRIGVEDHKIDFALGNAQRQAWHIADIQHVNWAHPLSSRREFHYGTSQPVSNGQACAGLQDCSPALGGAAWREPLPLATRPPLSGAERSSFYSLLGP